LFRCFVRVCVDDDGHGEGCSEEKELLQQDHLVQTPALGDLLRLPQVGGAGVDATAAAFP
jgi:hypothetical protein